VRLDDDNDDDEDDDSGRGGKMSGNIQEEVGKGGKENFPMNFSRAPETRKANRSRVLRKVR
jgi:hypothetical protein